MIIIKFIENKGIYNKKMNFKEYNHHNVYAIYKYKK